MKIISYTLKGFIPFTSSKIASLSLKYPEDIQIILGTNGSGKSSYLRTLTPYPLSRSSFTDTGFREMVIEHDGHLYTLTSDYSNKTSPHRFVKDDEGDLNEGGTTGVQTELVEKYFSLTKEKEALLFDDLNFCDMKPGQVKPFLMKICPLDLGWILDRQKKVSSHLRSIKAELKYLTTRETELLSQLSSKEELNEMRDDKEKYRLDVAKLYSQKDKITEAIKLRKDKITEYHQNRLSISKDSLEDIENKNQSLKTKLSEYRRENTSLLDWITTRGKEHFSKENYTHLENTQARLEDSLILAMTKIKEIDTNLDKTDTESVETITTELTSLKLRESDLRKNIVDDPFTENEIESIENRLSSLGDILQGLSNRRRRIWSRNHYLKKVSLFERIVTRYNTLTMDTNYLEDKIAELEKQLNNGFNPNAVQPCAGRECILFRLATEKRGEREEVLKELKREYNQNKRYLTKYSEYITERTEDLKYRRIDNDLLGDLFSLLSLCPQLRKFIKEDFLIVLSDTPHKFFRDIETHVSNSKLTNEYHSVLKKIRECEKHLKDVSNISESYKDYLLKDKETVSEEIERLQKEIALSEKDIKSLEYVKTISSLEDEIKPLEEMILSLRVISNQISDVKKEITKLEEQYVSVDESFRKTMDVLTQIEMVLSNQEKIISRYEDEVKSRKTDLETKLIHYTDIEYALIEMPKQYMRKWLTSLVDQVNRYIAIVWNQPLVLQVPNDDKDYKFTAHFKGSVIDNLSVCSSAQKDIINLCMCLALRSPVTSLDGIGMRGYPLALDEFGATFDEAHKHNLINFFSILVGENIVSQMYLTSHHAVIHGALANIQTLVLNSDNIVLPANYNQEVEIAYK